jgi:cellulose synthase/poly-beta-1,6-N-acetylglucosamine synthase-like glycosyltransferase
MPTDKKPLNVYHNAFTRYHHDLSLKEIDWFWGALSAIRKEVFVDAWGFDERYQGASSEDLSLGMALFDKGHRIVYIPEAQGAHAHQFTLLNMIKNDYQKAVIGMKMLLSYKLPKNVQGFVNQRSVMTLFLLILCPLLILLNLAIHVPCLTGIFFLIFLALIIINRPYYAYLSKIFDVRFRFFAPLLHWLQMYTIIAGAMMGAVGYLLGRTVFGRPKWI